MFERKIRILMICKANICRSPLAEGMLRYRLHEAGLQRKVSVCSAGTRVSQPGHRPDSRAQRIAREAGITLGRVKARQVSVRELARSNYVLAMDYLVLEDLQAICPDEIRGRVALLMDFASRSEIEEVPDPYYGNYEGFGEVFRLIDEALSGLLVRVSEETR